MRCKFCFAPLPKKGLVCDYCGQRNPLNLGKLQKIDIEEKKAEHSCPVCDVEFDNINIGLKKRVLIQRCDMCDGIFMHEDILEELMKKRDSYKEKVDLHLLNFIKNNPRQKSQSVISYRKCPICSATMQRFNYKAVSGVVVDRCLRHGVWLDGGEFRQLIEWKEVGGKQKEALPTKNVKKERHFFAKTEQNPPFDPIGDFFMWLQGG